MSVLIKNIGNLYTPLVSGSFAEILHLKNVSLIVEKGIIKEIKKQTDPQHDNRLNIVNGRGKTLLPGFVDAHTHPVFWKTREAEFIMRIEGKSYEEIASAGGGIRNSARNFQKAGKTEIKEVTAQRLRTFLEYGTTTIEAKSGYGLSLAAEIKALEIIAELNAEQPLDLIPTFLGAHEVPDEYRSCREDYIQLIIEKMLPQISERKLAEYCDVFCEKGVFSIAETRRIIESARQYGFKARIHADELHRFGAAELAAELGASTADHLVKVSDNGISAMSKSGTIPVLLPATTFFLRKDEYAPARKMLNAGCDVAVATDFNPGSSMTQNMQFLWTIAALKLGLISEELLWATTLIPAKTIGREREIGSIEIGKKADLILLDIPNLDYLAYHMGINHVFMTIKNGEIVYSRDTGINLVK